MELLEFNRERFAAFFRNKNHHFAVPSRMMWYFPISFQPLMLCTASASMETCSTITSAVLMRMWCLVMLTLWKNNPSIPFSLMAVKEALVFICTWTFCVCQLHNINCHNYWHDVLWDWSRENTKKVNFLFTWCSIAIFPYWTGKPNIARASMSSGILAWLATWRKDQYGFLNDYQSPCWVKESVVSI